MSRYLYAAAVGAAVFAVQLLIAMRSGFHSLAADSDEIVAQILAADITPELLLVLGWYLALGVISHIVPLLLASKMHCDLLLKGGGRFRDLLAKRGSHTLLLMATVTLMVITNYATFPASRALPGSDLLLTQSASPLLMYGLPLLYGAIFIYWIVRIASSRVRFAFGSLAVLLVADWAPMPSRVSSEGVLRNQPDIIVIGVDSLRPDYLQGFGYASEGLTPNIDGFLREAIRFDNSYTPMARTFVSYMSILSGRYPARHGARENLYPAAKIDKAASIAHRLKGAGYTTLFAMDESRFANFDEGYGFDTLVTPPSGIADFLVAEFLDSIGSNLLQLLPYSHEWMPHVAGNRAAATTYRPEAHDSHLARAIAGTDAEKPLFLVSHYCIAHLPYLLGRAEGGRTPYEAALHVADGQVAKLMAELESAGRLRNALVVMLSDHGEALALQGDQWFIQGLNNETSDNLVVGQYFGHGLPAMDEGQVRVLLAMQQYRDGRPVWPAAASQKLTGLVDVVPTLLSAASIRFEVGEFDGRALLDAAGTLLTLPERPVFVESGLSGTSLQKEGVNPGEVAREFGKLFELTSSNHLQLKRSEILEQLRRKQRAVLLDRYGVSSWPTGQFSARGDCWMKLDRITRYAQCLPLQTADAVVTSYKALLCQHFKDDREFVANWCAARKEGLGPVRAAVPFDVVVQ